MTKIKLIKKDELVEPKVKNNIPIGSNWIGTMVEKPRIGNRFLLLDVTNVNGFEIFPKLWDTFSTSVVKEIITDTVFITENSIYHIIKL
jgi:hypothetical protein